MYLLYAVSLSNNQSWAIQGVKNAINEVGELLITRSGRLAKTLTIQMKGRNEKTMDGKIKVRRGRRGKSFTERKMYRTVRPAAAVMSIIMGITLFSGCAPESLKEAGRYLASEQTVGTSQTDMPEDVEEKQSDTPETIEIGRPDASEVMETERPDNSESFCMDKERQEGFMVKGEPLANVPDGYKGIYSIEDLQKIKNQDQGNYILMSDLDMSGVEWKSKDFFGTLNGNYHVIKQSGVCLFGDVQGKIMDLGLENVNANTAALAESIQVGTIDNCYVTGQVHGHGGIVCLVSPLGLPSVTDVSIEIRNCYNAADIANEKEDRITQDGVYSTGGIVGKVDFSHNEKESIRVSVVNCENYGKVDGMRISGGIIGEVCRGSSLSGLGRLELDFTASGCFNFGAVNGSDIVGGIIGNIYARNDVRERVKNNFLVQKCANYNDITVSGGDAAGGAIIGDVYLDVSEDYNAMLVLNIEDCLNTAAIYRDTKDGNIRNGGGVCGNISFLYGTCAISRCINIGNRESEYNNKTIMNNSSPAYRCTDYYTEQDMTIGDMKNISANLSTFRYPYTWGIDSYYNGFPHPYGMGETAEVMAYYEKRQQEAADTILRGMDESEIILMQRYADMLASIGLGGYWPEDKEHEAYQSYITEYSDNKEEHFYAIADIDQDGQKELLVRAYGFEVRVYSYDIESGEIKKEDWLETTEEFEEKYDGTDEIQWIALRSENYSVFTRAYTNYYTDILKKEYPSDVGVAYIRNSEGSTGLVEVLNENFGIQFEEVESELYYKGNYEGAEVFYVYMEDGTSFHYQNQQVGNLTLAGLYPGMREEEVGRILSKYGFFRTAETSYCTGGGFGNYFISCEVENGIVTGISIWKGSFYAG